MKNEGISLEDIEIDFLEKREKKERRKEERYTFYTWAITGCLIALTGLYMFNGEFSDYLYNNHLEKATTIDKKVDEMLNSLEDYFP